MYIIIYDLNPILMGDYSKVKDSKDATWLVLNFSISNLTIPVAGIIEPTMDSRFWSCYQLIYVGANAQVINCATKGVILLSRLKSEYLLRFWQNLAHWWPKMSLKLPLLLWALNSYVKFILSTKKLVEKLSHSNLCLKMCICVFWDIFGQILT